nr:immunoglobulin light chain junction region [Macaca mulatta]
DYYCQLYDSSAVLF